ncbi:4'-phosphopantetheinyl transferase family protein [Kitasatospora sp. NBC_01266]|uniref:4'-phosphopantetheinyl transferase family protein n=1 Tax=Kitasatospora sp. NBC_01266 TaxID=2903572 RepID=UPI002E3542AD|nr:4'-phosphopantetheinyl transferase superfamily protein [Kitasatospora sp. NBC_01266]
MDAGDPRAVFDAGVTHVWHGTTRGPLGADDLAVLSAAERDRARQMAEQAGLHYAGAHVAVRRILAGYLGTEPAGLRMGRLRCPECGGTDHGAPCVVWPPSRLSYSLSRSGPHWLLGITAGHQLGVDLEASLNFIDAEQVAPMVLSPSELAHLRAQGDDESRFAEFLRCWTRKEAVLKASGIGLMADVSSVDVQPARPGPVVVRHSAVTGPGAWVVADLRIGGGRWAAIAREPEGAGELVVRAYSPNDRTAEPHAAAARLPVPTA